MELRNSHARSIRWSVDQHGVIIAIAWFVYRPLLSTLLLVAVASCVGVARFRRSRKKSESQIAKAAA